MKHYFIFKGETFSDRVNNNSQRATQGIRKFNHEQFGEVLTITDDNGKVWFKANDIARALGYNDACQAIRKHCKGVAEMTTPTKNRYSETVMQMAKYIGEADIYRLVMRSKLPQAEKFQDWVVEVVLPSIRKHGAYMTDMTIEKLLADPEQIIRLATQLKEEKLKRID